MLCLLVDLNLYNKKVIVIGGGTEGTRKVRGLVGQNSKIIGTKSQVKPLSERFRIQRRDNNHSIKGARC